MKSFLCHVELANEPKYLIKYESILWICVNHFVEITALEGAPEKTILFIIRSVGCFRSSHWLNKHHISMGKKRYKTQMWFRLRLQRFPLDLEVVVFAYSIDANEESSAWRKH